MIRFTPLASSSYGCCYLVEWSTGKLLLECGLPWREIQRRMNHRTRDLDAILVSHEHKDHSLSWREALAAGIPVWGPPAMTVLASRALTCSVNGTMTTAGGAKIASFPLKHDVTNYGYQIDADGERLVYLTDTPFSEYRFQDVTILAAECNYDTKILKRNMDEEKVDPFLAIRIMKNHMSLHRLLNLLRATDLSSCREIWLLHLSDLNSDEAEFKRAVERATGKVVKVAEK